MKGLIVPLLPGSPGADLKVLVEILDRYVHEQWAWNVDTTQALAYGYKGGVFLTLGLWSRVADGTIVLANNVANYVERDGTGVVSANIVGFTGANTPMAKVTTKDGSITTVEDWRP